jgi:hypothetical protein
VHLPHGCWAVSRVACEAARYQVLQSRRSIDSSECGTLASVQLAHDDHGHDAEGISDSGVKRLQSRQRMSGGIKRCNCDGVTCHAVMPNENMSLPTDGDGSSASSGAM